MIESEDVSDDGAEQRGQYIPLMGSELGPAYCFLQRDLMVVIASWKLCGQLYTAEHIRLFDETAGTFFGLLQRILLDDTILGLARLVDRAETGEKQNLTLQRLPSLLRDHPELQSAVAADVAAAKSGCQAAVDWRNRRIAHRDLDVALSIAQAPLAEIPFKDIDKALETIAGILNRLEAHFNSGATVMYDGLEMGGGGVESLVFFLERGLEAEQKGKREV